MNIFNKLKRFFNKSKNNSFVAISSILEKDTDTLIIYDKNIRRYSTIIPYMNKYNVYPEVIYISEGKVILKFKPQPKDIEIKIIIE